MNGLNNQKEIQEAQAVGRQLMTLLEQAEQQMNSARKWGIFDMLGGGLITDLVKHSKMDNAQSQMKSIDRLLKQFKDELDDVELPANVSVEISSFATFADYFFDGFFSDLYMQSKIVDQLDKIRELKQQVQKIMLTLDSVTKA